jgi:hypothetical protein
MNTSVTIFKFKPKFLHFFVFVTRNSLKDFFKVINNRDESLFHFFFMKTFKVLSLNFLYYISVY